VSSHDDIGPEDRPAVYQMLKRKEAFDAVKFFAS
jgi:hypothetical protein